MNITSKPILYVLFFVALVYLAAASNGPPRSDEAKYVLLARSLAQGHGYSNYPLSDTPHAKYPYLYPLLIAPLQLLFPNAMILLDITNALVTLLAVYLVFLVFRALFSDHAAALYTFLVALNPYTFVQYSHRATAEALYVLFSLAAILFLQKYASEKKRTHLFLAIVTIAAACYARQIGIVLLTAAVVYLLYQKDYKAAMVTACATTLLIFPWWYRVFTLLQHKEIVPFLINIPGIGRIKRFYMAFSAHSAAWAHWVVFPTFFTFFRFVRGEAMTGMTPLALTKHLITAVIILPTAIGFWATMRKKRQSFDFYVILYGAAICFAGHVYSYRLLYPIVPFLFYYLVIGARIVTKKIAARLKSEGSKSLSKELQVVCFCFVLGSALLQDAHQIYRERTGHFSRPWNVFFGMARWVRDNIPESKTVMCYKPDSFYLTAHRKAVTFPFSYTREADLSLLLQGVRYYGVDYIIITDPNFTQADQYHTNYIFKLIETHPKIFVLHKTVRQYGAQANIYRVVL